MPTGYDPDAGPGPPPAPPAPVLVPPQPADWVRDPQRWAIVQERQRHEDALYAFGEYSMFVLLWNIKDMAAGLVVRCPICYTTGGKITEAFGQAPKERCEGCFGTTFEGGFRALIVRPALWSDADDLDDREQRRGHVVASQANIEATHDFTMHTADFAFRGDGTRWKIGGAPDSLTLHTGMEVKAYPRVVDSWSAVVANREDESSVAYDIAYTTQNLKDLLDVGYTRNPVDYSAVEVIRGPLLL